MAAEQQALTPSKQVPDFLGNLVSIGDRVVVVFREERVRVGSVESFSSRQYMGYDVPTMRVLWDKTTDGKTGRSTAVDYLQRVFIKLFEEN